MVRGLMSGRLRRAGRETNMNKRVPNVISARLLSLRCPFVLFILFVVLSCGRREPPDLSRREDFASLMGVCVESTRNLYVSTDGSGNIYLSPTDSPVGVPPGGGKIEPVGSRVYITEFSALSSFDGPVFYCYGSFVTSPGKQTRVMINNFLDRTWFVEAQWAALNNLPATKISRDKPPIDYSFLRVCG